MILEIDAGNSRIKWRIIGDNQEIIITGNGSNAMACSDKEPGFSGLEKIFPDLHSSPGKEVKRVRVSSVRGAEFDSRLSDWLQAKWQLKAEFAEVKRECGGVTNSYADVSSMGVDRWLAMLAAYKRAGGACCVLDCGSATTYDWLDDKGVHQGGYIVPGLALMQESLARKTPALNISFEQWAAPLPASNTGAAITGGIVSMLVGFAERCFRESTPNITGSSIVEGIGGTSHPVWFLTGGDAEQLSKHLSWSHLVVKDLVMEGLGIALP